MASARRATSESMHDCWRPCVLSRQVPPREGPQQNPEAAGCEGAGEEARGVPVPRLPVVLGQVKSTFTLSLSPPISRTSVACIRTPVPLREEYFEAAAGTVVSLLFEPTTASGTVGQACLTVLDSKPATVKEAQLAPVSEFTASALGQTPLSSFMDRAAASDFQVGNVPAMVSARARTHSAPPPPLTSPVFRLPRSRPSPGFPSVK